MIAASFDRQRPTLGDIRAAIELWTRIRRVAHALSGQQPAAIVSAWDLRLDLDAIVSEQQMLRHDICALHDLLIRDRGSVRA